MSKKNGRFEIPLRTATLKFEGEYTGAEATCRLDIPLSLFFHMQKMAGSDDAEMVEEAMRMFGDEVLTATNLNVDGTEVTPDADGLMRLPLVFVTKMFQAWAEEINADAPLVESTPG